MLSIACLALPRKYAILPFLVMACFIPSAQRVVFLGLDFDYLRILTLFGWLRVMLRGEYKGLRMLSLDWLMLAYAGVMVVTYGIQQQTSSAVINRLGVAYNAIGMYFYFRWIVREPGDIIRIGMWLGFLAPLTLVGFLIEHQTGRNLFSVFGGVPEITKIRNGRMRCQGAFSHPILAGMFFAVSVPVILASFWVALRAQLRAIVFAGAAAGCVVATASSTPVMGLIFAAIGCGSWFVRNWLGPIRIGLVLTWLALSVVMKAPVYHLVARINVVGGSTSWHRYNLMHQFFTHPMDWLFVGTRTTETWGVSDITNQFVLEGIRGGLITLLLFVACIVVAFVYVGQSCRKVRSSPRLEMLFYALGVSLFVHITGFIGVSYFGQITMLWYLSLALIASAMSMVLTTHPDRREGRRGARLAAREAASPTPTGFA